MNKYDILLGASVHKSADNAIRLALSAPLLSGHNLLTLASDNQADVDALVARLPAFQCDTLIFKSSWNSMYACRAIGFIYAIHKGIMFDFYGSLDDDIEFTPASSGVLDKLCNTTFSIMTFNNGAQHYQSRGDGTRLPDRVLNQNWINGDSMFTHAADNLLYGVADSLDTSKPSFTECEYQHRMRVLTGRPLVVFIDKNYYQHHFQDNAAMVAIRSSNAGEMMSAGSKFFATKYDMDELDFNRPDTHPKLIARATERPDLLKRHLLFGGLFNDWSAIYTKVAPYFTLAGHNTSWA